METDKPANKLFYIIPAAVLVLVVLTLLLMALRNKKPVSNVPTAPTPTRFQQSSSSYSISSSTSRISPKPNTSPTLIPVNPFTGVIEDQHIPKEETDLATQKRELRKKTPLAEQSFSITFSYADDLFVVTLKEPKQASKTDFTSWLKTNYPLIPLDRFEFK